MSVIDSTYFSNYVLNAISAPGGILYQRKVSNLINASISNAVNIGTLEYDKTQLNVTAQVMKQNPENYYKFTLKGNSLKVGFVNSTATATLRLQLLDSKGSVIADSEGTADEIAAYNSLTTEEGLSATAGDYYVKVSYGSTALKTDPQTYVLSLYSGTHFNNSYQTIASSQTSNTQKTETDNTMVYATADALQYTNKEYNKVNAKASTAVNLGWLYENKSALKLTSLLTQFNSSQYYSFTLQKGASLKLAFNNNTDTTSLRVQLLDPTGISVYADSEGTKAQKEAYEKLTSSTGLKVKTGQYVVKVTYGKRADRTSAQTYNFKLYSGDSFSKIYETTASAESFDTALLNGNWGESLKYNPMVATALHLYTMSQDEPIDIMQTLRQVI